MEIVYLPDLAELAEGLVFVGAFAVACGFLARAKGRSVPAWSMLGLVFNLAALLVLIVLPRRPTPASGASGV